MNAPHEPAVAAAVQTLASVATTYLDQYRGRDTSRHYRIQSWQRLLGDKPILEVTADDVDTALATLANETSRVYAGKDADGKRVFRKKGTGLRSGSTLNRYTTALGALYTWARRQRLIPRTFESPTKNVEKSQEGRGRVRFLDDGERDRLLQACRAASWPRLFLLVLMAMTTGARRGELLGLRWCDVDLDRGEAILHDSKNGDRRMLVLLPQVLTELERFAPKDRATSQVLVFRSTLRASQPFAVHQAFRDAVALAEIKEFRFHDLRHCCASYMAQQGASLLEIADTLGHRQLRMVQRYAHLNTDSRRRLMSRVFEGRL